MVHLLAPLLFGVGAHGTLKCVPRAQGPGMEVGEPDTEPAGRDVGLGSQPPRHKDKLPNHSRLAVCTGRRWYVARLGSHPHSLTAFGTGGAAMWAGSGSPRPGAYPGQVERPQFTGSASLPWVPPVLAAQGAALEPT